MFKSKALQVSAVYFGGILLASGADHRSVATKNLSIKPRATHAAMAERQKPKRDFGERKTVKRKSVSEATQRKQREGGGLVDRSAILSSSANWSLVPKGAVLHVPGIYAKRVNDSRSGKLVGWQDFYGKNRSWIRTIPVTIDQASGKTPLTNEYLAGLKKGGQVLIAVCRGGPISVNLPKAEEVGADPADPKATAEAQEKAANKADLEEKAVERLKRRLLQRAN